MRSIVVAPLLVLPLLASLAVLPAVAQDSATEAASQPADDPMALFGIHVTEGAAAGYVDDRMCARCHAELAESYREVAMAQSFYRPRESTAVEDFDTPFVHEASDRIYRMRREGDRYFFRRHQVDTEGQELNAWEVEIDWIMGSGNHSRVYLYRIPSGELYQLPIAWYAADASGEPARWGMAPGFDNPWHNGVTRIVQRECMFCHNAYPEVPAGSDLRGQPHLFPEELPEGLGCQRCHGPGAEHVRISLGRDLSPSPPPETDDDGEGDTTLDPVRSSIVNPARLASERRDELCDSCHLQPTVVIPGMRHFGRPDYSYQVGEPLEEFFVAIDVEEDGTSKADRFEINHHPYRLRQSRCYTESAGEMSCLTCHDPHRKVSADERAAHYRAACLSCHTVEACQLEAMGGATRLDGVLANVAADDCASCHMPKRRSTDVIQVVMTDHTIQRRPDQEAMLDPLEEKTPILVGIELIGKEPPTQSLGEIYRALAVERAGGQNESLQHLRRHLPLANPDNSEPWFQLIKGLSRVGRNAEAHGMARRMRQRFPEDPRLVDLHALTQLYLGRSEEGLATLHEASTLRPERPEGHFNLGRILLGRGEAAKALPHLESALSLRPNFTLAWFYLGQARAQLGETDQATDALRRALALDPSLGRAYLALSELLLAAERPEEAERWWRHGRANARHPGELGESFSRQGQPSEPGR